MGDSARVISDRRRARKFFMDDLIADGVNFIVEVGPQLRRLEADPFGRMSELHRIRRETREAVAEGERPMTRVSRARSTLPPSIRETWENGWA